MDTNKRRAMIVGLAGAIAVVLAATLATGAIRGCSAEQPDEPEQQQEQTPGEEQAAHTPEQAALSMLVGNVWKSPDGKATLTFKDSRYVETEGSEVDFATFDVKQVTAREDGFALTLRLDATRDAEAKDSLVVIAADSKGVPTVSSDDFRHAGTYVQSREARASIAVAGVTDDLLRLIGGDDKGLVLAIEEYTSKAVPGAKTATWSEEVLVDFKMDSVTTTFTCDDPAKTLITVMRSADGKYSITG
ncbi:MAG: hypothetical protein IJG82_02215 [Atopobiaceae bacterium]|nr:hypothetical protein [Atopobiaceae bacterium]